MTEKEFDEIFQEAKAEVLSDNFMENLFEKFKPRLTSKQINLADATEILIEINTALMFRVMKKVLFQPATPNECAPQTLHNS